MQVCNLCRFTHSILTTILKSSYLYPHLQVRTPKPREVTLFCPRSLSLGSDWGGCHLAPRDHSCKLLNCTISTCREELWSPPSYRGGDQATETLNTETQRVGGSWHISHWWMDVQSWSRFCWDSESRSSRSWAEVLSGGSAWIQAQMLLALSFQPWVLGRLDFFARFSQCCCPFLLSGALDSAASLSILVPCSPSHWVSPAPACGLVRNYSLECWGRVGASAIILPLWGLTAQLGQV